MDKDIKDSDIKKNLMNNTINIRNISVIAHVDHGKTSLVDSLISYNNIINPRLAGQIRYMDSLPDEQERCITMKASSISICYNSEKTNENYYINIIDSPGHVDFSSEICTALKVCEGGLLVIDVIEGICSQTISVLRQAFKEKVKLILIFNKIDRLITEIKLNSYEAYNYLNMLLEKVNSIISGLIDIELNTIKEKFLLYKTNLNSDEIEKRLNRIIEKLEDELYFNPSKGNVVFACAIDSWAFSIDSFAFIYSRKFNISEEILKEKLWGENYLNYKTLCFSNEPFSSKGKPLFVELILDSVYKLYTIIIEQKDKEKVIKISEQFGISLPSSDISYILKDPKQVLRSFMRQWLPIPNVIFQAVIENLPSPIEGFYNKIDKFFDDTEENNQLIEKIYNTNKTGLRKINQETLNNISSFGLILKMINVAVKNIPNSIEVVKYIQNRMNEEDINNELSLNYISLPFARCFSGTIFPGKEYYLIGPKHNPKENKLDINKVRFDKLYSFMGDNLEVADFIPAGCIFSVWGLGEFIFKNAVICEVDYFPLINYGFNFNSILKVSISTEQTKNMTKMIKGLKMLNKSDPAIEYYVSETGQHILETSGEVHLERAIKDLEERLCNFKLIVSPQIIDFREGLNNINYNPLMINKKKNKKNKNKEYEKIDKNEKNEKKNKTEKDYLSSAESDQDKFDIDEARNSSMPMAEKKQFGIKKPEFKHKNIVLDYKNRKENIDFYIEKCLHIKENQSDFSGYYENITNNKYCTFKIQSLGLSSEVIDFINKNETIIKTIERVNISDQKVNIELQKEISIFKKDLIGNLEKQSKYLTFNSLIEDLYIISDDNNKNFLFIRNLPKEMNFFKHEDKSLLDYSKIKDFADEKEENKIKEVGINKNDYILENLRDGNSLFEFYNSIKLGWKLACCKYN